MLLAVPAQTMRTNLERWKGLFAEGATLVSAAKGIELGTLMRMSQVIIAVTGVDSSQVAVISGPTGQRDRRRGSPLPPSSPAAIPVARLPCSAC